MLFWHIGQIDRYHVIILSLPFSKSKCKCCLVFHNILLGSMAGEENEDIERRIKWVLVTRCFFIDFAFVLFLGLFCFVFFLKYRPKWFMIPWLLKVILFFIFYSLVYVKGSLFCTEILCHPHSYCVQRNK